MLDTNEDRWDYKSRLIRSFYPTFCISSVKNTTVTWNYYITIFFNSSNLQTSVESFFSLHFFFASQSFTVLVLDRHSRMFLQCPKIILTTQPGKFRFFIEFSVLFLTYMKSVTAPYYLWHTFGYNLFI